MNKATLHLHSPSFAPLELAASTTWEKSNNCNFASVPEEEACNVLEHESFYYQPWVAM
jgi:hypothetical protein